jgi:hypothetical protein
MLVFLLLLLLFVVSWLAKQPVRGEMNALFMAICSERP